LQAARCELGQLALRFKIKIGAFTQNKMQADPNAGT
jgi:hypothetical protein